MRTVFYLSNDEHREIKTKGLTLQVSGETFMLMVDGIKKKSEPTAVESQNGTKSRGAKPGTPFPKPYPTAFRAKVLKAAKATTVILAAKKYDVSSTTIRTWQKASA